ncbi:hypothetical protein N9Y63_08555 [Akkermansiaceae bacterium]|nr:hypothetical protein [Akkermansiaceae bacterium]
MFTARISPESASRVRQMLSQANVIVFKRAAFGNLFGPAVKAPRDVIEVVEFA